MAAPRVPTNVLDARGTIRKHRDRERARAGEPKALKALGAAPGHLSEAERACWAELVGIAPAGVLWAADRVILAVLARPGASSWTSRIRRSAVAASSDFPWSSRVITLSILPFTPPAAFACLIASVTPLSVIIPKVASPPVSEPY